MTLKEEIGGIIYDADIYKAKVTTGQLNNIVDDIMKEIEYLIDKVVNETDCSICHNAALVRIKELLK